MNHSSAWLLSLCMSCGNMFAQESSDEIVIGNKINLASKILEETREIWVSTPPSYQGSTDSYPVLYLLDPEFHFHHATSTVNFLGSNNRIPEMLVVAIRNTDRVRDFTTPSRNQDSIDQYPTHGGADNFLRFIDGELIPYVETSYRTRPYRILVGHSLGGLFAIHALTSKPEIFDAYIAISPSLQWSNQDLVAQSERFFETTSELQADFYMTTGNEGLALAGGARKVAGILEEFNPRKFRWDVNFMEEETHGTVPHRSIYLGLESIFQGWYLHDPLSVFVGGIEAIDRYYVEGSSRFGYKRNAPASILVILVGQLIDSGRLDDAAMVLQDSLDSPPTTMLDRLAAAYAEEGDPDRSRELYTRSFTADPRNDNARSELIKLGVDVEELIPELPGISVAVEVLQSYVGKYDYLPNMDLTVSLDGSELSLQIGGSSSGLPLHALSETRFATIGIEGFIEFVIEQDSMASRLIVNQDGREQIAIRIE